MTYKLSIKLKTQTITLEAQDYNNHIWPTTNFNFQNIDIAARPEFMKNICDQLVLATIYILIKNKRKFGIVESENFRQLYNDSGIEIENFGKDWLKRIRAKTISFGRNSRYLSEVDKDVLSELRNTQGNDSDGYFKFPAGIFNLQEAFESSTECSMELDVSWCFKTN